MAIDPISMPNAAAVNYGDNDVRHMTEGDAVDVPGLSQPTRHLAQRDVALANKLNEVVAVVNNKEQFVPMPVLRTTLPPNAEEIVQNFRIPVGFECRVLNAIVTSIPASSSAELNIYYQASSFGNSTGTQVISTSTEFTAGTSFYSGGEFIITLKNRGGATLEMIASILLTMRPVGETSAYLLSAAVVAPPGPPGQQGIPGTPGSPGIAGPAGTAGLVWYPAGWVGGTTYDSKSATYWQGSSWKSLVDGNLGFQPDVSPTKWELLAKEGDPGFNWTGDWVAGTYAQNDGVFYTVDGCSYVANAAATAADVPGVSSKWDKIAQGGTGFRYRGAWSYPTVDFGATAYVKNDVVTYTYGGALSTYVAVVAIPVAINPPGGANTDWQAMVSAASPAFSLNGRAGKIYVESDYTALDADGQYAGISLVYPGTNTISLTEVKVSDPASGHGMCVLKYSQLSRWLGSVTLVLPQVSDGAAVNWLATDIVVNVTNAGTVSSFGTIPSAQAVVGHAFNGTATHTRILPYMHKVTLTNPWHDGCNSYLSLVGFQTF